MKTAGLWAAGHFKEGPMKRVLVGVLSGFLLLVVASPYSYAQMCGCGPAGWPAGGSRGEHMSPMWHDRAGMKMERHHRLWHMLAGLGLDEKQKEAIREIKSAASKDDVRKRAEIDVARIELWDMLGKDQVDMAAAEAAVKKISSLQADLRIAHIRELQEIKAKLTPEQRKKFKELREMGPWADQGMQRGKRTTWPGDGKGQGAVEKGR